MDDNVKLNEVYCMDNLELLKQINDNFVDLIYCDILYNTGKRFKDYDDRLGTPQEAIEWYKPRLIEMKRILKDTGSICLQCDYRLVHYLKVEMDNIFGIDNFINEIIWHYQAGTKPKNRLAQKHDNILLYGKTHNYTLNEFRMKVTNDKAYNKIDENGERYLINGQGKKYYLKDGRKPDDVWSCYLEKELQLTSGSRERVGYDTQKPKALLERIVKMGSDEGNIVADFFCGSGTSLVVAKELGRQYIGCDINPRAIKITNERLTQVG